MSCSEVREGSRGCCKSDKEFSLYAKSGGKPSKYFKLGDVIYERSHWLCIVNQLVEEKYVKGNIIRCYCYMLCKKDGNLEQKR